MADIIGEAITGNCKLMLNRMIERGKVDIEGGTTIFFMHDELCANGTGGACDCCPSIGYGGKWFSYFDIMGDGRIH